MIIYNLVKKKYNTHSQIFDHIVTCVLIPSSDTHKKTILFSFAKRQNFKPSGG